MVREPLAAYSRMKGHRGVAVGAGDQIFGIHPRRKQQAAQFAGIGIRRQGGEQAGHAAEPGEDLRGMGRIAAQAGLARARAHLFVFQRVAIDAVERHGVYS